MEVTILRIKENCVHFYSFFFSKYINKLLITLMHMNTVPLNFNYGGAGAEKQFEPRRKCLLHNHG